MVGISPQKGGRGNPSPTGDRCVFVVTFLGGMQNGQSRTPVPTNDRDIPLSPSLGGLVFTDTKSLVLENTEKLLIFRFLCGTMEISKWLDKFFVKRGK